MNKSTALKPPGKSSVLQEQRYLSRQDFGDLYDATYRDVFRYIYGLTGGPQQDAEDLTAETYLRAWDKRKRFKGNQRQAVNWLLTIARRLMIDRWRGQNVRPVQLDIDAVIVAAQDDHIEQMLVRQEQNQTLLKLLNALPDDKRELIVLRYMLGWRVNRIAEYVQQKDNTVSVTIRRILQHLQDQWPENAQE